MPFFSLAKPFIHAIDPETAHHLAIKALRKNLIPHDATYHHPKLTSNLWGLDFSHPVGLAAGFDKNGEVIAPLLKQGFSFVEAGSVTPEAQEGNPKPRLFRLQQDQAIINRMGFNNSGKDEFIKNLNKIKQSPIKKGIIGANIGKNKLSPNDASDYLTMLESTYGLSDYITVNISSPNTPNLRDMQSGEQLFDLLQALHKGKIELHKKTSKNIPLLLKIAPDVTTEESHYIAEILKQFPMDGLIISNTTLDRTNLKSPQKIQQGGLSGAPLFNKSTQALKNMYQLTEGKIPLIGVGGISNGFDAYQKIRSGASLIQIYSVLVYKGFGIINDINRELVQLLEKDGFDNISDAIGADMH